MMQAFSATNQATAPAMAAPVNGTQRLASIDLLRGLVMIIMALDHSRDFLHDSAWTSNPLDPATTTPLLYFTRWITHFCAPVFVLLAGSSIYFQAQHKPRKTLSWLLLTRGLWLVVAEVLLVNLFFTFDPTFSVVGLQTIWAIGISMVCMAALVWLPFWALLSLGAAILLGHNALDVYEAGHKGDFPFWYSLLHRVQFFNYAPGRTLMVLYPFLPWLGVMIMGYGFGRLFLQSQGFERQRRLVMLGSAITLLFVVLRMMDNYGDPGRWEPQANALHTFFDFMDVQKYPPSLLYLSATLGPALLLLAWFQRVSRRWNRVIITYGRVPFFYYLLHFLLLHLVAAVLFYVNGHSLAANPPVDAPLFILPGQGYPLWVVYAVWVAVVAALYPLVRWFCRYKQEHKQWWLSYL